MEPNRYTNTLSFLDLLFLTLIGFVFLFVVSFLMMNPPQQSKIDPKAEIIVIMSWADNNPHDIDLWCLLPATSILRSPVVNFKNPSVGLVYLDRDDRGSVNDTIKTDDGLIVNPVNQEVMSWRGLPKGTYTIGTQFFSKNVSRDTNGQIIKDPSFDGPIKVHVELIKLNPRYSVLKRVDVILDNVGREKTAFSFTILEDGSVVDINTEEKKFINQYLIGRDE